MAPSQSVSASVNLLLHDEVRKFSSGTGSPEWSWKKGRKTVVVVVVRIVVMAALHSRRGHYIFVLFLSSSFFPRLFSVVADWMSTILPLMMWP